MSLGSLGTAAVTIKAVTKPLDDALKRVHQQLNDLTSRKVTVRAGIGGIGGSLAVGIGGSAAGLAGTLGAAARKASDLEEAMNKAQVVFGKGFGPVTATVDELVTKFGESRREMIDLVSQLGIMYQGVGLNERAVAGLSSQMARLAIDMSSLQNVSVQTALEKLRSGISGEIEPLRTVGIAMNAAMVEEKAYQMGLARTGAELNEQQKVIARHALIMQLGAVNVGDAARTHGQFAGQLRELRGRFNNLGDTIGAAVVPAFTQLLAAANRAMVGVDRWFKANEATIAGWVETLKGALSGIAAGWDTLTTWSRKAGVYAYAAVRVIGTSFGYLQEVMATIGAWVANNWSAMFVDAFNAIVVGSQNLASNIGTFLRWFGKNWRTIFEDAFNAVTTALANLGRNFRDFGKAAYDWIASGFTKPFDFQFTPVMQGFDAKTEAMPEMKPILEGFKALSEKLNLPELPIDKMAEIMGFTADQIKAIEEMAKAGGGAAAAKGDGGPAARRGGGMDFDRKKEAKAEFVGIAEFARKIQEGALGGGLPQKQLDAALAGNRILDSIDKKVGKPAVAVAGKP